MAWYNLIQNYQNNQQIKFNNKIERYLKGRGKGMKFNPLLYEIQDYCTDDNYTYRLAENSVWYSANEERLLDFYKRHRNTIRKVGRGTSDRKNYFYSTVTNDFRKEHSGLPGLISRTMVKLIMGNGYKYRVEDDADEKIYDRLTEILEDNNYKLLQQKGIETESWSGGAPFKISINPLISKYPIVEVVEPEHYSHESISGRITKEFFYKYYKKDKDIYRLTEEYGVDEKGSYIRYYLHKQEKTDYIEVSLKTIPETSKLKDVHLQGYYKRLSMYKPNRYPNSEFRGVLYGESDYTGSITAFDTLDEIISSWDEEIRQGKLDIYRPEWMSFTDTDGKSTKDNPFRRKETVYSGSISENDKDKIEYHQAEIRVEQYIKTFNKKLEVILNNAGLSPLTIGVTGLEALNAGDQSQKEREKVSIRTRNDKIELWETFNSKLFIMLLEVYDIMQSMEVDNEGNITSSWGEYEVTFTFADYILKSKADRTTEASEGVNSKTWDIKSAVAYIHDEMSELDQLTMVANIKLENNIDAFSPSEATALANVENATLENLIEEGAELITPQQEVETVEEIEEEVVE